jgi:hypothetical protein
MSLPSPVGVTGIIGSRCLSPHVLLAIMIISCPAGSATRHAINIIVYSYSQIQAGLSATGTALRCGPILEMVIFVTPMELQLPEVQDIRVFLVVRAMLRSILIPLILIQNLGAN